MRHEWDLRIHSQGQGAIGARPGVNGVLVLFKSRRVRFDGATCIGS